MGLLLSFSVQPQPNTDGNFSASSGSDKSIRLSLRETSWALAGAKINGLVWHKGTKRTLLKKYRHREVTTFTKYPDTCFKVQLIHGDSLKTQGTNLCLPGLVYTQAMLSNCSQSPPKGGRGGTKRLPSVTDISKHTMASRIFKKMNWQNILRVPMSQLCDETC